MTRRVESDQGVAKTQGLWCPVDGRVVTPAVPEQLGEGPQGPVASFYCRNAPNHQADCQGIDRDRVSITLQLNQAPSTAQQKRLLAANWVEDRLSALQVLQRNGSAPTGPRLSTNVGSEHTWKGFRQPENVGFKSVQRGIHERNKGPRPPPGRTAF